MAERLEQWFGESWAKNVAQTLVLGALCWFAGNWASGVTNKLVSIESVVVKNQTSIEVTDNDRESVRREYEAIVVNVSNKLSMHDADIAKLFSITEAHALGIAKNTLTLERNGKEFNHRAGLFSKRLERVESKR